MAQNQPMKKVEKRFNANVLKPEDFLESEYIVGFEYLNVPIITNNDSNIIRTSFHWGLVPSWSKDLDLREYTLNARIETIQEKPSFKNVTQNRCLVIATSFYEWHWNDEKGKSKDKYQIFSSEDEIFAMAGIYTSWNNPDSGELYNSFSIVTTQANKEMEYIHNHKKRMPIILKKGDERSWLDKDNNIQDFAYPKYEPRLVGFVI